MTTTIATLDGVASTTIADLYITGVRRQVLPAVRDVYLEVPGRAGSWHFPEQGGDRELTLGLLIGSDTFAERRASARALGRWLWPSTDLAARRPLILDDEPDRYELVAVADTVDLDELLETGQGSVTFRTGPYALAVTEDTDTLTLTTGTPADTLDVAAADDLANDLPFTVEVTPSGVTNGFTLTINGDVLVYEDSVAGGETITVDTDTLSVLADGAPALTAVAGTFARLQAGTNNVELAADTTTELAFAWRRRYV